MPELYRRVLEAHKPSLRAIAFRERRPEFEIARFFRRCGVDITIKDAILVCSQI